MNVCETFRIFIIIIPCVLLLLFIIIIPCVFRSGIQVRSVFSLWSQNRDQK